MATISQFEGEEHKGSVSVQAIRAGVLLECNIDRDRRHTDTGRAGKKKKGFPVLVTLTASEALEMIAAICEQLRVVGKQKSN